jgi:Glucose-regulated metallo-peptidase M90
MPLSKILAIPFAIITVLFLYLGKFVDSSWGIYSLLGLIPLVTSYIMSSEIDWWRHKRNPPELEEPMAALLEKGLPFYQRLDAEGKKRFGQKVSMFIIGNVWQPELWETIPRDVQVAIAAQAVIPLYDRNEWLYPQYEVIVVHPKGFMSPTYPFNHFSETYAEDGCVLFSAEHILAPLFLRNGAPMIGLYEYVKIGLETGILKSDLVATEEEIGVMQMATGVQQINAVAAAWACRT